MAELTVPQVNFGSLGELPGIYRQNQANALRQQTLEGLGQGGAVDANALIRSGDLSLAQLGLNLQNREAERARQAQLDQRQAARDKTSDSHWAAEYSLRKAAAARLEDPTPAGFQKGADGGLTYIPGGPADPNYLRQKEAPPSGYTRGPDGAVTFIPGGPQDPATITRQADAWKGSGNAPTTVSPGSAIVRPGTGEVIYKNGPESNLDDETIKSMAEQARAGDVSVFQNLGRGAQGAENIVRLRKEIVRQNNEGGVSGAEQALRNAEMMGVKAGQRTIGTKGANIEMAATEFNQVIPIVQAASKAVPRTNFPDLNKILLAGAEKTGDPNVVKFGGGVNTLINLYARAISPTGTPTVSDKDHAREILSKAWAVGQFDAAVGMMQQEIKAALESPEKVRDEMRARFLRGQGAAPVGYPAPGAAKPVVIDGYKITEH